MGPLGGTVTGGSDPMGARCASRRPTIVPPLEMRAVCAVALSLPEPARWNTRSHSMSMAADARSRCHLILGRFGVSARQLETIRY